MFTKSWFAGVVMALVVAAGVQVAEDAHDKVVYGRYTRKLAPSPIKLGWPPKFRELDHSATMADVESGKAIFTFDGLGEARVWSLPKCCHDNKWPSLGEAPHFGRGYVLQAEELKVGDTWKRYFGFLCEKGKRSSQQRMWSW